MWPNWFEQRTCDEDIANSNVDYWAFHFSIFSLFQFAFGALTLLVGRQKEHPACKNWVMRCWCGYLSAVRCRLFAYGPADATAPQTQLFLASFKSRLVLPFWLWLTQVVLEKRPLNRCGSSSSFISVYCDRSHLCQE